MKKSLLLLPGIVFTLSLISLHAQQLPEEWVRSFQAQGKAADRISKIATDASGNVYSAGYAGNHHGAADAFAMKRNPAGDTLWIYYYDAGGYGEDYAVDLVIDNNDNVYITGNAEGATSAIRECFTAKILPTGVEAWVSRYSPGGNPESFGNALVVDATGNVYVAGYVDPLSASNNWLVIKYNSAGVEQWVDVYNGPDNGEDVAMDIVIAPNGNPTVCGYTYTLSGTGSTNALVKQYTPANGTAWTDTWNNASIIGADMAYALGYSSGGDLFVGGQSVNINGSNRDAFALKYNSAGVRQWASIFSDTTIIIDEYLTEVFVDNSGNVYFTGSDYLDGFITRINNDGSLGWRREWVGPVSNGLDIFLDITVDNAGSVYTAGRCVYPGEDYYGNGGRPNMIIAKYSSAGDSLWTYRCQDSLNSSMGFAITSFNNKIIAGGFVTDTAYVDENLYTHTIDTAGNAISEWIYNGIGDAITMGQFVETDANNNIYCAATIDRLYANGYDVVLIKYDPLGNLLWEKYYSTYGWNNDTLTAMQFDPSGNLILCISTDSAQLKNNYRLSLVKADQNGMFIDTAWHDNPPLGNTFAKSMAIRNDGSVALAASSSSTDGIVIFFDAAFNHAWTVKTDSTQFAATRSNSVAFFPNGDLLVGGLMQLTSDATGTIQRYDDSGAKLWSTNIDSVTVLDEIRDVTLDANGDVVFTGSSGSFSAYTSIVGKLAGSTGNLLWRQVYNPNTNTEHGVKVRVSPAGNIALITRGWTGSVARYFILQYSDAGSLQWANVYSPTASNREPIDILIEPSNRVVTAGWATNGFTTNYDYVLTGFDASGAVEFVNGYTNTQPVSFSWDQLNDLTRDSQGSFIVTGQSSQEFFNNYLYKMLTIKYGGTVVGTDDLDIEKKSFAYVYPNPSLNGLFTLLDASPIQISEGKVFDLQGRFVVDMNIATGQIDLSTSQAGIYLLALKRDGLPAENIRLVVN
ncbi:MAG: T9SS type A sorting domain-containing protein [Bacteroidia bacterium]|nr:T9SS type A sorting domain-containing protein [Bacteroidia bacterium]